MAKMQNTIFSVDSAKAIKAQKYGYLNAIYYLAPANLSGFELCPDRSPVCTALCLGWHSGQAGMVAHDDDINNVRKSRMQKAQRFMRDRPNYLADVIRSINNVVRKADKKGLKPCVRLNGSSDIAWEGIRIDKLSLMELFPAIPFVDYTKNPRRFDRKLPPNYHLTFSRSETNEPKCIELLNRGVNVAVVFAGDKPTTWNGFDVIDGDLHDLRQLDPRGPIGTVIGLSPKGHKAKRDVKGFVVR